MKEQLASAQRQLEASKSALDEARAALDEEKEARKLAEARAMELRVRMRSGGGNAPDAADAGEAGAGEPAGEGAGARDSEGGEGGGLGKPQYRCLFEKNPILVDSFWVPVDTGVQVRTALLVIRTCAQQRVSGAVCAPSSLEV